jgi:hypothetical protein
LLFGRVFRAALALVLTTLAFVADFCLTLLCCAA